MIYTPYIWPLLLAVVLLSGVALYRRRPHTQPPPAEHEHTASEAHQKQIEEIRAQLAAIVESSDDAIISKTLDGIILTWNKGAERIYGYSAQEIIGQSIAVLVPADLPDEVPAILNKIKAGQNIEHYETTRQRKDGQRIDVSLTSSPIHDSPGHIIGTSTIAHDITDRKQAEAQREFEREEKDALINSTQDLIWSVSRDFKLIAGNQSFIKSVESFSGKTLTRGDLLLSAEIFSPELISFWEGIYKTALSGKIYSNEFFTPATETSQASWLELSINPIWNENEVVGVACFGKDITQRKQAEDAMRFQAALLNAVGQAVIATDTGGIITYLNSAAENMYGWAADEALGRNILDVTVPEGYYSACQ